jgi:CHAD domain-containing protein
MSLTANVEREVKLEVGLRFTLPDLNGVLPGVVAVGLADAKLQAVYIDTVDLRLMRWGVTLRHRRDTSAGGTGESDWTVKLPQEADGVALVRRELSWPGTLGPVPAEVASLVRAHARSSPLGPVAKLNTQRRRVELRGAGGAKLAEVDDDVVSVMDGRVLAARFREVEVEVAAGAPPELLEAVLERMTAAGALSGDNRPKVVRALGPRAVSPPDVVVAKLGSESTISDVVGSSIAAAVTRMIRHDPGVRLGDDPEHVHQARVGTRRLRSDLRTFRRLLDPELTARVRAELGWVADALGEVRDADVLTDRLRSQIAALPDSDARPAAGLLRRLALQRDAARGKLLAVLDSDRYVALLDQLAKASVRPPLAQPGKEGSDPAVAAPASLSREVGAVAGLSAAADTGLSGLVAVLAPATDAEAALDPDGAGPPSGDAAPVDLVAPALTSVPAAANGSGPGRQGSVGDQLAREVLPGLVRKPWRHLRDAAKGLGDDPPDHALHQVRIQAKRLRYAAEAAEPVIGKPAKKLASAVAEVQGVLGDMQDAVVAEAWLRQAGTSGSASQALVAGVLIARERDEQAACRKAWVKLWRKASAKKLRAWLDD